MRGAPAVSVAVARRGFWQRAVMLLVLLAAWSFGHVVSALAGFWPGLEAVAGWPANVLMASLGAIAILVWHGTGRRRLRSCRRLCHVAGNWWLEAPSVADGPPGRRPGQVWLALDLGDWLLVHWAPAPSEASRRVAWLPLSRAEAPQDWHLLRVLLLAERHRSQPGADSLA